MAQIQVLARRFIKFWALERQAKAQKREVGEALKPMVGADPAVVGDLAVYLVSEPKKEPTKTDIEVFFGKGPAERFWAQLAPKANPYLTVDKAPRERKAV